MKIHVLWVTLIAVTAGFAGNWLGFKRATSELSQTDSSEPGEELVEVIKPPVETKEEPVVAPPTLTDEDIEKLIAEVEDDPKPRMDPQKLAELEARRKRWENMSLDQRRMLRKSMFSALAEVDGLEEVEDAVKAGKLDPRTFKIDPEGIADRMEFYADTMDQKAMQSEVTKTLQGIVDQANSQLKK